MSILKNNTEGPNPPKCDKRNKYIVLVIADAKDTTADKAKKKANAEMRTARTKAYGDVKKKKCPQQCKDPPGKWDGIKNKQGSIVSNTKIGTNPNEYYAVVWGTSIDTLTCPKPPKKKKKGKKKAGAKKKAIKRKVVKRQKVKKQMGG